MDKNRRFCRLTQMRATGIILSILCSLIAIVLLWLGYICTFESDMGIPTFESTPPEGWDYWMRVKFWHDVRWYSFWVLLAVGCAAIPILGVVRSRKPISNRRMVDWILFVIAAMFLVYWLPFAVRGIRRIDALWVMLPPLVIFNGCLYGLRVFWLRARGHSVQAKIDATG
jgi:hypothetical protein